MYDFHAQNPFFTQMSYTLRNKFYYYSPCYDGGKKDTEKLCNLTISHSITVFRIENNNNGWLSLQIKL